MGVRLSVFAQNGPGANTVCCKTSTLPLSWGQGSRGHGVEGPFPSSADVKEIVELYLYSPSGGGGNHEYVNDCMNKSKTYELLKWC